MNDVIATPAFWSAIAAFGSFVTAVVIAVSSKLDRAQQRELAAQTALQPGNATRTKLGCMFFVENQGPRMAWEPQFEVYHAPSLGIRTEAPAPEARDQPKSKVVPVGAGFRVQVACEPIAAGAVNSVGLTLRWKEEHGHRREVDFEVPVDPVTPGDHPQ